MSSSGAERISFIDTDADLDTRLEYYTPAGSSQNDIRYLGSAPAGSLTSDSVWIVKRLTWEHFIDGDHVMEIQTLEGVSWDNRSVLPWA